MAATVSDIANGVSITDDTACATGATVTAAIGNWLIVIAASANAGTNGAASQSGVTDSDGVNVYTQQALINYDPGATSAGATLGIYTCPVTSTLALDTITVNHSVNTPEKAVQVYLVVPGVGETISLISVDTTGNASNTVSHTAAQVSVTDGDIIFGGAAIETDDTVTGDTDTSNGSWSSILTRLADNGADAATMSCASQYKTVTATGNQIWTCTTATGRDSARTYLVIRSAVAANEATLAKTLGAVTSSGNATVDIGATAAKTLGAVTPSANATIDIAATSAKTLGAVTASANTDVAIEATLAKTLGALTLAADATVGDAGVDATLAQTLGALTLSANATVDVEATLTRTLGAVTASAAASVDTDATGAVTLAAVTSTSAADVAIAATASRTLGDVTSTANATVDISATLAKTLADVTLAGDAISGGAEATLAVTLAALTVTGAATVDIQATLAKTLGAVTLAASGSVDIDASLAKTLGALAAAAAASVDVEASLSVTLGAVTLSGNAGESAAEDGDCALEVTLDSLTCSGAIQLARRATSGRPGAIGTPSAGRFNNQGIGASATRRGTQGTVTRT